MREWVPLKEGPRSIVDALNLLGELVTGNAPVAGRGVRISELAGGKLIEGVPLAGSDGARPWKLVTYLDEGTPKLRCHYGRVDRTTIHDDSAGDEILAFDTVGVSIGSGDLVGDPDAPIGAVGSLTLTTSTTYGVWLKVPVKKDSWDYYEAPGDETIDATIVEMAGAGAASVVVDSTNTDPGDAGAMVASTSGYGYLYLGRVTVDADGVGAVEQFRSSDIVLPATLYPAHIISTDNSNDNAITKGTDNGVYLAPDGFVTGLTDAGGITVSDNGDGTWEVTD